MNSNEVRANYVHLIDSATVSDAVNAGNWYSEAQAIAMQLSIRYNVTLEVAASVIAAFSPRTRWAQNVLNAEAFLNGDKVPALGNNIRMAERALELGFNALKGAKTNAFARNIAGDMSKVTIDVWMIRAAGYDRLDANKSMNTLMTDVIVELAGFYNVAPAQLQALIWIVVRGNHE
jgi:hypothetical protein